MFFYFIECFISVSTICHLPFATHKRKPKNKQVSLFSNWGGPQKTKQKKQTMNLRTSLPLPTPEPFLSPPEPPLHNTAPFLRRFSDKLGPPGCRLSLHGSIKLPRWDKVIPAASPASALATWFYHATEFHVVTGNGQYPFQRRAPMRFSPQQSFVIWD